MKISLRFLAGLLTTGIIVSFAGSVSGVLAWYVYSNRATISYSGTTIYSTESLQIGLPNGTTANPVLSTEEIERFGLVSEEIQGVPYVFEPVGETLSSDVISQYLRNTGYTAQYLLASTSNAYHEGDTLSLKRAITYMENYSSKADKNGYVTIPMVFRIPYTNDGTTYVYAKNQNVYLTDIPSHTVYGSGELEKAIRVYVDTYANVPTEAEVEGTSTRDTSSDTRYLISPNATKDGSTIIGGVLDLNNDGYYDFDTETNREYLYGSYTGTLVNPANYNGVDTDLDDVNNTGSSEASSFLAKHYRSVTYGYSDYTGILFDEADYYAPSSVYPVDDGYGNYSGGKPMCTTSNDDYGLGRVDFTVYLEGWDHSIIDQNIEHTFQLGFQFSINKVS